MHVFSLFIRLPSVSCAEKNRRHPASTMERRVLHLSSSFGIVVVHLGLTSVLVRNVLERYIIKCNVDAQSAWSPALD